MFFRSEAADGGWYNKIDAIDNLDVTSETLSAMRDAGGTLKEQRGLKCRAPAPYSGQHDLDGGGRVPVRRPE